MSVLFADGMDFYNSTQAITKWNLGFTGAMSYSSTGGRFGGGSLLHDDSNFNKTAALAIPVVGSTYIIGFAVKMTSAMPNADHSLFRLYDGSTVQCEIAVSPLGQLKIYSNATVRGTSASNVILLNTWHHIEWKITITNSTGSNQCVLRVDNTAVLNLTGVDTQTSGNSSADSLQIGRLNSTAAGASYDDFYLLDNNGAQCNDLLGDCRIETLMPSGAGTYTQFTHNGAATNWQAVSEVPADDDTSYVDGASLNDKDSYAFANPSGTVSTVFAVQSNIRARKDNAGVRSIAPLTVISGTDYVGTDRALSTSYALYSEIMELNPDTGVAWTGSDINALDAGYKVTV